jgi:hypothetical protein
MRRSLIAVLVTLATTLAVVAGIGFSAKAISQPASECPTRPYVARPIGMHLSPGVEQHESWLEFAIPEVDATAFTLCLDGRLFATGVGEAPADGRIRVSVPTRWVDVEWLRGRLDSPSEAARWELGYTTYTRENG